MTNEVVVCSYADVAPWRSRAAKEGASLIDRPGCVWAWVPGKGCGCVMIRNGTARFRAQYVVPDHRRQGVGAAIALFCFALAEERCCSSIDAFVNPDGMGAAWYEKQGWRRVGRNANGGIHMRKVL